MSSLLLASLDSHYYTWWAHWNYWNDDFYSQWAHQMFFTLTELFASLLVLGNLDRRRGSFPLHFLLVATTAAFHIGGAMQDQFLYNVLQAQGKFHQVPGLAALRNPIFIDVSLFQVVRDVFLMGTDLVQILLVDYELKK